MITSVIFDWGGTLTPWHTIEPLEAWLAAVGDPAAAARLHDAENAMWLRCRDEQRSATLDEVFAQAGIAHTEQMLAAFHAWWEPHTLLDPDAVGLFTALHARGIKVGVLSNTIWPRSVHEQIFVRDEVAHLIDGAVYTSEIPWTKPAPEAFRAAMDAVGSTEASRCVYVGDRLFDDVWGAQNAGLRAIHVPHSVIPADQAGHTDGVPDATVHRLSEIPGVLDRWR